MIERDLLHFNALVEEHQASLRRDWRSAHAGPGPVRQSIGRQLIRLGEMLGGKHADLQDRRLAGTSPAASALAPR
jgi:hypothetical protein